MYTHVTPKKVLGQKSIVKLFRVTPYVEVTSKKGFLKRGKKETFCYLNPRGRQKNECKQLWNRVKVSVHITDGMSRQIFVLRQRRSFFLGYSMPGTTQYGKYPSKMVWFVQIPLSVGGNSFLSSKRKSG